MFTTTEKDTFIELRVLITDQDGKPVDLSQVTASVLLVPREGPALKKDLQLMQPEQGLRMPTGEPKPLQDGRQVRLAVAQYPGPFAREQEGGPVRAYFKADVPADLVKNVTAVTIEVQTSGKKEKLELRSPAGR